MIASNGLYRRLEMIQFKTDNGKQIKFNPKNVKCTSQISKYYDDETTEFIVNIWYKNGKKRFLKSLDRIKLMKLKADIYFAKHKNQIAQELQSSF